jgi:hypothetical protein
MALATAQHSYNSGSRDVAHSQRHGRWDRHLFHLLALSGAATVIAGSYMTWATFYAGLIARNGVSGHGKYFIGLALAAALAAVLSSMRQVWDGLRWLVVPAAIVIAAVALRDLRNLEALIGDPAAGFYLPGRGPGLFVVISGAVVLGLSPFARPVASRTRAHTVPTIVAALFVAGVALLVPGLYGEYYLHIADGHVAHHADAADPAHVMTGLGAMLLLSGSHLGLIAGARRSREDERHAGQTSVRSMASR